MKKIVILAGLLSLVFGSALESEAFADRFGRGSFGRGARGGASGPFLGGFGGTSFSTIWDLYLRGDIPVPPYFSLHPPVYYSRPVPRTYGYSPFAYPGTVRTPEFAIEVEPETIINPYVPSSTTERANEPERDRTVSHRSAPEPLVITNPYVTSSPSVAQVGR